jgi:hypothetical protein
MWQTLLKLFTHGHPRAWLESYLTVLLTVSLFTYSRDGIEHQGRRQTLINHDHVQSSTSMRQLLPENFAEELNLACGTLVVPMVRERLKNLVRFL